MIGINNHNKISFNNQKVLLVCLFLAVATLAVFWQVKNHEFLNFDDRAFVTDIPQVQAGLTLDGAIWSFKTLAANYWQPATWLSHMLDFEVYGLNPAGHHWTSVLFHIANTLLLFFLLKRMTGALWKSAFVALLFALHPLHVESVAWIAERKDVLCAFFWLLCMGAYCRYAERPGFGRYLFVLLFFVLGLMSKPMVVTLPFVLLLTDYWPLGRLQMGQKCREGGAKIHKTSVFHLVLEKVPLFILTVIVSAAAFITQQKGGALASLGLSFHVANALVSYLKYIGKMFFPVQLAIYYPYPKMLSSLLIGKAIGALLLLVCLTVAFIRLGRRFPYLVVGWLWFLGTLIPVIGLVKVGNFAMADRYTYIPLVGLFIIAAWGLPQLVARLSFKKVWLTPLVILLIVVLMALTQQQVSYWKNSITLFEHALEVTSDNYMAHNGLGVALKNDGRPNEAISHYLKAIRIKPDFEEAHNNLGFVLLRKKENQRAIKHFLKALKIKPDYAAAHSNLGVALEKEGRIDEAISHFSKALGIQPDPASYNNLGFALFGKGDVKGAVDNYLKALSIRPDYVDARYNLGIALEQKGRTNEAGVQYLKVLSIQPDYIGAHNNLGVLLVKKGHLDQAIGHYQEALRLAPQAEDVHNNLGIALFFKGDVKRAIYHFQKALRINPDNVHAKRNLEMALTSQNKG